MRAGFQIEHQCPQCGAPAILEETDRLFACTYCLVKSYLLTDDVFRYVLPHKAPDRELLYFPYWRFKGAIYSCVPYEVKHRFVDTSIQGIQSRHFPSSVGLRTQAMKLKFATTETAGRFLPPSVSMQEASRALTQRFNGGAPRPVFHQAFVGETLSLIYSPFYLEDQLFDAILNRPVSKASPDTVRDLLPATEEANWRVGFTPTLCPRCGWDLEGERNALALTCRNCCSLWTADRSELVQLEFSCIPGDADTVSYLPFWRIEADVDGIALASYADLVRAANLPKIPREEWEHQRIHFWSPAFKIQPNKFLRLARALTLAQPDDPVAPQIPKEPRQPITLPAAEAIDAVTCILATILNPPQAFYPKLDETTIRPKSTLLVYIPFRQQGNELLHDTYKLTVNRNALRLGTDL